MSFVRAFVRRANRRERRLMISGVSLDWPRPDGDAPAGMNVQTMSDIEIRRELNSLNLDELIHQQRKAGRRNLPKEFCGYWAMQNRKAASILRDPARGQFVRRLAGLLDVITRSICAFEQESKLGYYTYTDVFILDWYLGRQRETFATLRSRALKGICL